MKSRMGWPPIETALKGKALKPGYLRTYGDYTKLCGKDLTWEQIQREYDRVYDRAVEVLTGMGHADCISNIRMIVHIVTEKHSLLGDLVSGDAPLMTIGWKCEVYEE